ncbi:MAG: DUF2815 family protein [Spirochaetales bacterium]|jgi:hypothetical protein|nr:DUF2815 family protein [Spirochaetales bacterium]
MATVEAKSKVVTPKFRCSYLYVFEVKKWEDKTPDKWRYEVDMLFPKSTDLTALKEMANEAAIKEFGNDKSKWPDPIANPFKDGDKNKDPNYHGMTYISAKSKNQPGIVDSNKVEILNPRDFKSGDYARAQVTAFAYNVSGNAGVSIWMDNVQKLEDGDSFAAQADSPEAAFNDAVQSTGTRGGGDFF